MSEKTLLRSLLEEGYRRKTWHGPNLRQSLRGLTAKEAARRPKPGRHNIWELVLHSAYWKYAVRRQLDGGKRGSFVLKGSNFFKRPDRNHAGERAWQADLGLLDQEHRLLERSISRALRKPLRPKDLRMIYGVCFHDIYHAGQIRLVRRLMAN